MRASDEELLRRIAGGDACAFEAFYARHEGTVRQRLLGMLRNADTAEDVLQEAFLRVWMHAPRDGGIAAPKAWLLRITTNAALNAMRSVRRRREEPLREADHFAGDDEVTPSAPAWLVDAASLGPGAVAEQVERQHILWRLVDDLPEAKRELVRMVYDAEMEVREAAEHLGIPEGTAKSRLHHARKRLASEWRALERLEPPEKDD